jgi:hypothetical protein
MVIWSDIFCDLWYETPTRTGTAKERKTSSKLGIFRIPEFESGPGEEKGGCFDSRARAHAGKRFRTQTKGGSNNEFFDH